MSQTKDARVVSTAIGVRCLVEDVVRLHAGFHDARPIMGLRSSAVVTKAGISGVPLRGRRRPVPPSQAPPVPVPLCLPRFLLQSARMGA